MQVLTGIRFFRDLVGGVVGDALSIRRLVLVMNFCESSVAIHCSLVLIPNISIWACGEQLKMRVWVHAREVESEKVG